MPWAVDVALKRVQQTKRATVQDTCARGQSGMIEVSAYIRTSEGYSAGALILARYLRRQLFDIGARKEETRYS
jgi:hypothetical protein